MRGKRLATRLLALLALCGACASLAWAQASPTTTPVRPAPGGASGAADGEEAEAGEGIFGFLTYRFSAADHAPLTDAEAAELEEFAVSTLPPLARLLRATRDREPQELRRRLARIAPQLRFLRRMTDADPRMGQLLVQHFRNNFLFQRAQNRWAQGNLPDVQRRRIEDEVRRKAAENLRLEMRILDERARVLETQREELVAQRIASLSAPDTDLTAERPDVREAVEELRAATTDEGRALAEALLHERIDFQIQDEIDTCLRRMRYVRANGEQIVERRVQRILTTPPAERQRGREGHRPMSPREP
ncbi:MAG: hypothetical protein AB7Q17_12130 [Phycisphaerae bacterium]